MNSLTTKLMSASLGLALVFGASMAMTAAGGILAASDAEARTASRSTMIGRGGQKTERTKIDFGKLKDLKPAKHELARERIADGKKDDLAKRIGEKQAKGRGRI
jgi:hypothetical protein